MRKKLLALVMCATMILGTAVTAVPRTIVAHIRSASNFFLIINSSLNFFEELCPPFVFFTLPTINSYWQSVNNFLKTFLKNYEQKSYRTF